MNTKHTPGPLEIATRARNQAVFDGLDYEACENEFTRAYDAALAEQTRSPERVANSRHARHWSAP